jgi:suppressor of ftsI
MNDRPVLMRFFAGAFLLCLNIALTAQSGQPTFVNPPKINYSSGTVELTGAKATIDWAGFTGVVTNVYSATYAGKSYPPSYAPPTLHINPGNTLQLNLTNDIDNTLAPCLTPPHGGPFTNLHYHGTEVSPLSPGDDVFIEVRGTPFLYQVPVPAGHPDGMFWYHPHPHGCSFGQVNDGMSGALIIGDLLADQFPFLVGIKEQILLIKDGDPRQNQNPPGPVFTINGLNNPVMSIDPGELQFWRIGNVGTDTFARLVFSPAVKAWVVAVDGFVLNLPILLDNTNGWLLPTASRVELIVQGPAAGTYKFKSLTVDGNGPPNPVTIATLVSAPDPTVAPATDAQIAGLSQPPANRASLYPADADFQGATTDNCTYLTPQTIPGCTFAFTENNGFQINNHTYDMNHLDVSCPLPSKNKWTICNTSSEHHAFHLHQIHFHVDDINGSPIQAPIRDTVDLPPQTGSNPSVVHITAAFINPIIAGEFVLHCHILAHEDLGMMQNIQIVQATTSATKPSGKAPDIGKPAGK